MKKPGKKSIAEEMEILRQRREERKNREEKRVNPQFISNNDTGKTMDADYEKMIRKKKIEIYQNKPALHTTSDKTKISVLVRKRPLSKKEMQNGEIDCVSVINPKIIVHECKIKIDGITKYLEDHEFYFDNTFGEDSETENIYDCSVGPMIDFVLNKGIVTCFAYGQTGSGKTYTMKGIQNLAIESLFSELNKRNKNFNLYISFFEIYGGRLFDLLNNKAKLQVLDDKNGKVQIFGLQEIPADNPEDMTYVIDQADAVGTTHNTVTNETSSRSHAICNIVIKEDGANEVYGKLSLVDLAGSERAQETQSNNRQRRAEGAEINKSLLALKECIRALDARKSSGNNDIHVPFRASKLTHVLRDSFISKSDKCKIIMISCVSPCYTSSNHTINTLRYSDRLKEKTSTMQKINNINNNNNNQNRPRNKSHYSSSNREEKNKMLKKEKEKELDKSNPDLKDPINMNVFDVRDDILNDINFDDKMILDDDILDRDLPSNKKYEKIDEDLENNENDIDDLLYLKKTVSKEGKYISDEFIKYQLLTEKIVEDEDDIVSTRVNVIKDDAKILTEEGELITKIKGINSDLNEEFTMDEYLNRLEMIIDKKINMYSDLKDKLDIYKEHIKEEDEMRKKIRNYLLKLLIYKY
jgi:kinesin family protein 2/24